VCKLEGEELRVTLEPWRFVWFDVSRCYFPLPGKVSSRGIGQPVITPERFHVPIHAPPAPDGEVTRPFTQDMAWNSNLLSPDGYSPETGRVGDGGRIDIGCWPQSTHPRSRSGGRSRGS